MVCVLDQRACWKPRDAPAVVRCREEHKYVIQIRWKRGFWADRESIWRRSARTRGCSWLRRAMPSRSSRSEPSAVPASVLLVVRYVAPAAFSSAACLQGIGLQGFRVPAAACCSDDDGVKSAFQVLEAGQTLAGHERSRQRAGLAHRMCTSASPGVSSPGAAWQLLHACAHAAPVHATPMHLRSRARAQMGVSGKAARRFSTAATERRLAVYTTTHARTSRTPKALMTDARLPSPYVTLKPATLAACDMPGKHMWQH